MRVPKLVNEVEFSWEFEKCPSYVMRNKYVNNFMLEIFENSFQQKEWLLFSFAHVSLWQMYGSCEP